MRICLVYDCLFPLHGRRRRALVPEPRRCGSPPRATRSPTSRCASGRAASVADLPGVRVVAAGPRMALYARRRPAPDRAAARLRRRRALAPAAPRAPLRRRAHRLVPVLLAARRRRSRGASHRFRLVVDWHELWSRGYWREYLGGARRADRLGRAGALPARAAARVLLRAADRRRGCAPRACAARSRCSRASTPARSRAARRCPPSRVVVFAGRHIPEKRAPALVPAIALARAHAARAARRACSATGPSAARCSPRSPRTASRTASTRRGSSRPRRSSTTWRARSAWCSRRRARATGSSSSRPSAAGTPSVVVRGERQRRHRARRGRRERLRRADRPSPEDLAGGDPARPRGRRRAAALDRRRGSPATPGGCRSTRRSTASRRATRDRALTPRAPVDQAAGVARERRRRSGRACSTGARSSRSRSCRCGRAGRGGSPRPSRSPAPSVSILSTSIRSSRSSTSSSTLSIATQRHLDRAPAPRRRCRCSGRVGSTPNSTPPSRSQTAASVSVQRSANAREVVPQPLDVLRDRLVQVAAHVGVAGEEVERADADVRADVDDDARRPAAPRSRAGRRPR